MKPYLSQSEQIALLEKRGLLSSDKRYYQEALRTTLSKEEFLVVAHCLLAEAQQYPCRHSSGTFLLVE